MLDKGRCPGDGDGFRSGVNGAGAAAAAGDEAERAGKRAERPLPSTLRCLSVALLILENLLGQFYVAFGTPRSGVVHEDRLSEAGGLGQANTAGNYGMKNFVLEEVPEVVRDLARQIGPFVVHREKDSLNLELMRERVAHLIDGIHELGYPFKRKELALDGDQHGLGRDEGIQREEIEGWGAVDKNVIVARPDLVENLLQPVLPIRQIDQFKVRGDEIFVSGNDIQPFALGL